MNDFDSTWARITRWAGAEFHTKTGRPFSYDIAGNALALRNTNRTLPRSHLERALNRAPLTGPRQLQDLQGPSYLFAILTDPRVSSSGSVADVPEVDMPSKPPPTPPVQRRAVTPSTRCGREALRHVGTGLGAG